jgi:antitoxin (DNA-binding transcriptional repressor) of toxin-antitoxin stability system
MITIGIRQAKSHLDEYLRKVRAGERVVITERGKPITEITKPRGRVDERLDAMVRDGEAIWSGGKPRGSRKQVKIKGRPISETVIEDRR